MQAAQKSLERYNDEKKSARSRDEQDAAYGRYATRMLDIQRLSGTMVREDGAFTSATEDTMNTRSGATASTSADPRAEVLKRYGSILRVGRSHAANYPLPQALGKTFVLYHHRSSHLLR